APALTLSRTKSSWGLLTSTPGWRNRPTTSGGGPPASGLAVIASPTIELPASPPIELAASMPPGSPPVEEPPAPPVAPTSLAWGLLPPDSPASSGSGGGGRSDG